MRIVIDFMSRSLVMELEEIYGEKYVYSFEFLDISYFCVTVMSAANWIEEIYYSFKDLIMAM